MGSLSVRFLRPAERLVDDADRLNKQQRSQQRAENGVGPV
jgi:hypothetical protein